MGAAGERDGALSVERGVSDAQGWNADGGAHEAVRIDGMERPIHCRLRIIELRENRELKV